MSAPTWFITGCSSGLGLALAQEVIGRGFRAVVTARNRDSVSALAAGHEDRVLPLPLDICDAGQIGDAIRSAMDRFGRIDVLVNNAGYGYQASVEEAEEAEIRAVFETNLFGTFALTRAALPILRAQRSGFIVNIGSIAGFMGLPGSGYYAATKHALEGWSDALAAELAPIGIRVSCVAPGPFRTDFSGRSLRQTPVRIADYAQSAGARLEATRQASGSQAGDPQKAAAAIVALAGMDPAPRHLVLGSLGFGAVVSRLGERLDEIESLRDIAMATDFES